MPELIIDGQSFIMEVELGNWSKFARGFRGKDTEGNYYLFELISKKRRGMDLFIGSKHKTLLNCINIKQLENGNWMEILEYFPGETLRDLLNSGEVFSHLDIGVICVQICDALAAIHNLNLIHEDLRPENILINSQGEVKLKGILIPEVLVNYSKIPECWNYIAPEQISKSVWISPGPKANSYSLAAIIYELLTGKKYGKSFEEIDSFIKNSKDPILSLRSQIESFSKGKINLHFPEEFEKILEKSLSLEPEGRLSVKDISELLTIFINKSFNDDTEEPYIEEQKEIDTEENPEIGDSSIKEPSILSPRPEEILSKTFSPEMEEEVKEVIDEEYENDTKIINSEIIEEILEKENKEKNIPETKALSITSPPPQKEMDFQSGEEETIKNISHEERYEEQIYEEENYDESAEIKEFIPSVAGGFSLNDTYEKSGEACEEYILKHYNISECPFFTIGKLDIPFKPLLISKENKEQKDSNTISEKFESLSKEILLLKDITINLLNDLSEEEKKKDYTLNLLINLFSLMDEIKAIKFDNISSQYSLKPISEYIEQNRLSQNVINESIKKSIDVLTSYIWEVKTIS